MKQVQTCHCSLLGLFFYDEVDDHHDEQLVTVKWQYEHNFIRHKYKHISKSKEKKVNKTLNIIFLRNVIIILYDKYNIN